jgi:hypothetical protein
MTWRAAGIGGFAGYSKGLGSEANAEADELIRLITQCQHAADD